MVPFSGDFIIPHFVDHLLNPSGSHSAIAFGLFFNLMWEDIGWEDSIFKAKIARREGGEVAFPHALKPLTEWKYKKIQSRSKTTGLSRDYVRVNRKPYVVCESAERHGLVTQRTGTARYTRD